MRKLVCELKMEYMGNFYEFEDDFGFDYPQEAAEFMYYEGNYCCDCNRSLFIKRRCDAEFEEMECGEEIDLVEFKIKYI